MTEQEKKEPREFKAVRIQYKVGEFSTETAENFKPPIHLIEYSAVQKYIDLYEANLSDLLTARKEISAFDSLKEEYERFRFMFYKLEADYRKAYDELLKDAQGLAGALDTALRQWRMYMTDFNECDVESMDHYEVEVFRDTEKALKAWEGREK